MENCHHVEPHAALNFGMADQPDHDDRYVRAREFYDVVTGLWDNFANDAFIRDVAACQFFDPARKHVLGHKGAELSVRGLLDIPRPVQGWWAIVQAGSSEPGRQLAAETAVAVFAAPPTLAAGMAFYNDVKGRAVATGRATEGIVILPDAFVLVGDTVEVAWAKHAALDSLVHSESAIASLSIALGTDASVFDPDAPLPKEIPDTNLSKSSRERVLVLRSAMVQEEAANLPPGNDSSPAIATVA